MVLSKYILFLCVCHIRMLAKTTASIAVCKSNINQNYLTSASYNVLSSHDNNWYCDKIARQTKLCRNVSVSKVELKHNDCDIRHSSESKWKSDVSIIFIIYISLDVDWMGAWILCVSNAIEHSCASHEIYNSGVRAFSNQCDNKQHGICSVLNISAPGIFSIWQSSAPQCFFTQILIYLRWFHPNVLHCAYNPEFT